MTEVIERILNLSVESEISDIHLKPGFPPIVRRVGELVRTELDTLSGEEIDSIIKEIYPSGSYNTYLTDHEADAAISYKERRLRLNAYRDINGASISIRCLNNKLPDNITESIPKVLFDIVHQKSGLILITGPTGSGKSTTLATLINHLNETANLHIITIEDPVEYLFESKRSIITQREVGRDTHSFSSALTASLREDPDVIMLGEMRTPESIQGAITAAETGHLVFATLHTKGAVNSIDRIIDVFPHEKQNLLRVELSMVLSAVVSQQLIPSLDGGRLLATEIMLGTDAIKNLVRTGKTQLITSSIQTSRHLGMKTMDGHLDELYKAGKISAENKKIYSYNIY